MSNLSDPENWPKDAPPYHSAECWNYEKKQAEIFYRKKARLDKYHILFIKCHNLTEAYIELKDLKQVEIKSAMLMRLMKAITEQTKNLYK
jgi:hypothetical protein